jgi:hypothetical protein
VLSVRLLVAANLALFAAVAAAFVGALALNALQRVRARSRRARRKRYEDAVTGALADPAPEALAAALEPRRGVAAEVVEEALLAVLRDARAPEAQRLREAALRGGLYERNLRALRSPERGERVRAMQALGALRARQAVAPILTSFESEDMDVKLVALKALADIGDPGAVPYFVSAAYFLPRVMVVPLAAMLPRFGPPGRRGVQTLVARFPASFPPRVMMDLLRQAAADGNGA